MQRAKSPLKNLKIASPCSADWNEMYGDERKRFCGDCQLNVYNLSGMTRDEAEALMLAAEGRLCVRYFQRSDGTVLTADCPVGWAAVKRRLSNWATAAFSMLFSLIVGVSSAAFFVKVVPQVGKLEIPGTRQVEPQPTMGVMARPNPDPTPSGRQLIGNVSVKR